MSPITLTAGRRLFPAYIAHGRNIQYGLTGVCVLCASVIVFVMMYTNLKQREWIPGAHTKGAERESTRQPVQILFYSKDFSTWEPNTLSSSDGLIPYDGCSVKCFVTKDRSLIKSVDAIVIHDRDVDGDDLPKYRDPHQRWVYWNMEAPDNSRIKQLEALKDVFNWTYTYRRDSDVPHPYFSVRRRTQAQGIKPSFVRITNRSKLIVWAASNCNTSSGREKFVMELQRHIPVDIYGSCGRLNCPRGPECLIYFGEMYYFYLALENSICPEYVTEKFYNALYYGMVPVVLGNYSKIAPPGSYIDAFEFSSPKHLATYLKAVAADPSLYKQYFAWRRTHDINLHKFSDHCALCEALYRARPGENQVYQNIIRWWHGSGSACTSWEAVLSPNRSPQNIESRRSHRHHML